MFVCHIAYVRHHVYLSPIGASALRHTRKEGLLLCSNNGSGSFVFCFRLMFSVPMVGLNHYGISDCWKLSFSMFV